MLKTTSDTSKKRLTSVSFANIFAFQTGYESVFRFNINHGSLFFKGFIFNKELQSPKHPTVEAFIQASPMLSSTADSNQLLHNDYVTFLKVVYESPTNLIQDRINIFPFSSAQPFLIGTQSIFLMFPIEVYASFCIQPVQNSFRFFSCYLNVIGFIIGTFVYIYFNSKL